MLDRIAEDEKRHYEVFKTYTEQDVEPDWTRVRRFYWLSRIFGVTFGLKLLERGESAACNVYSSLPVTVGKASAIRREEAQHEAALLAMLDEERLHHIGSIVLGLNDALVELTGALAGLTVALQNTKLIAMTGCITGIAAACPWRHRSIFPPRRRGRGGIRSRQPCTPASPAQRRTAVHGNCR